MNYNQTPPMLFPTSVVDNATDDAVTAKLLRLQERAAEKTVKLNYADTDGTGSFTKHNKVVQTSGVQDFLEQGAALAKIMRDAQVHQGLQNPQNKVTLSPNYDDPTLIGPHRRDEFAETIVPKNRFGNDDTRNAYLKYNDQGTADKNDDVSKFGLAANDLNDEAIARGMSPVDARYSDQTKFWPYKHSRFDSKGVDRAYDGTPGPATKGEKTQFDIEFLNKPITQFEFNRYMDRATIDARAMGTGSANEVASNYDRFGDGAHEYTFTNKDPLLTTGITAGPTPAKGTVMPTVPYGFDKEGNAIDSYNKYSDAFVEAGVEGSYDSGGNMLQRAATEVTSLPGAIAYGAFKGVGNLLDFGGELLQRGTNAIFDTDFKGGAFEDGTTDQVADKVGLALGYNQRDDSDVNKKAQVFYDKAFKDVELIDPTTWGNAGVLDILKGMGTQLTNPSSAAASLGEIFGTGGGGSAVKILGKAGIKVLSSKAAKEAAIEAEKVFANIARVKADNTISNAYKKELLTNLNKKVTDIQLISNKLQSAIPAVAYSMDITNQHMADYRKNNNNEEMSNGRMFGTLIANTLAFAMPEIATTKIALGMNSAVSNKLKEKLPGGVT